MKKLYFILVLIFSVININGQQTPADKQENAITIEGATAHIGNGQVIENSLIIFEKGKITFVGSARTKIARKGTIIDAKNQHIYPGFIAPNASLGLAEIDAVKATRDFDEVGSMNPHIRSIIAYNAESKVVESMRPNGVLMAQIAPRGGIISGTSSIVQLDAWNWEDAALKTNDAIHLNWPNSFTSGRWWLGEDPALKSDPKYAQKVNDINNYFLNAKNYFEDNDRTTHLPYESTKGLFNKSQSLFVHVSGEKEIIDAVTTLKKLGIENIVIVNGEGSIQVADFLSKNNIPVILDRPHRNPNSEDDAFDYTYTIAKKLTEKGVIVSVGMEGQMERMNTRNLPFYVGTFAAHGLDKEESLKLITLNAAKILNIDSRCGTLETGKDATLFISKGDALDMVGNQIVKAYIQGRDISLETHQTKLWRRYSNKYKTE